MVTNNIKNVSRDEKQRLVEYRKECYKKWIDVYERINNYKTTDSHETKIWQYNHLLNGNFTSKLCLCNFMIYCAKLWVLKRLQLFLRKTIGKRKARTLIKKFDLNEKYKYINDW